MRLFDQMQQHPTDVGQLHVLLNKLVDAGNTEPFLFAVYGYSMNDFTPIGDPIQKIKSRNE